MINIIKKITEFEDVKKYLLDTYGKTKRIPSEDQINSDDNIQSYETVRLLFKKHTGKSLSEYFKDLGFINRTVINPLEFNFELICKELLRMTYELNRIPSKNEINNNENLPKSHILLRIFRANGYDRYIDFLRENGYRITIQRSRPNNLTYEQLCEMWENYFENKNRYPSANDCRYDNNLPYWRTVRKICGNKFNDFYEIYGTGKNIKTKSYKEYCNLFKAICERENRVLNVADLVNNDYGLPCSQWLIENCPDKHLNDYNDFITYLDLKPKYNATKEYAISNIYKKYKKLGRPLITSDFKHTTDFDIGLAIIYKHWGSFNSMLNDLDLPIAEGIGTLFTFEDGEVTKSIHEYNVSKFFRKNNIKYQRDVLYSSFVPSYEGLKNCDYVVKANQCIWYIEIAGIVHSETSEDKGSIQKGYRKNLKEKILLLNQSGVNYKIIYPEDLKEKSIEEIFSFLIKQ